MTKIAPGSPQATGATGGAAVRVVSDVARQPLRTCMYRGCRCEFMPPGFGRFCSHRCLQREFDETSDR